jgi:hypothetical protein
VTTTSTKPSRSKKTLTFAGPVGATAAYTITDSTGATLTGTATVGDGGYVTLDVDVSALADGVLTATVVETDILGNTANGDSTTWVKDTTAATGGFKANNGAAYTTNPTIGLALSFTDATSGIASVEVSTDGTTWTTAGSTIALSRGDGSYTVSVRVTDVAGNVATFTQQVVLDRVGPTVTNTIGATTNGTFYDVGSTVAFGWIASDANLASSSAKIDGSTAIANGAGIDVDSLTAGMHTITITAVDKAGNTTTRTISFTIHATVAGLTNAVNDGYARGYISYFLQVSLLNTLGGIKGGNTKTKLSQFVSTVQSSLGWLVTPAYGNLLINWANDLAARL